MQQRRAGRGASAIAVLGIAIALTIPAVAQTAREFEVQPNGFRFVLPEFLSHARDGSWVGIAISDADDADRVSVTGVTEESPAAEAGLREEDVIVQFDGERVRSSRHLARLVRETPIGREVALEVLRDGRSEVLALTTTEHPDARRRAWTFVTPDGEFNFEDLDLHLEDLAERLEDLDLPGITREGGSALPFQSGTGRLGVRSRAIDGQLADFFGVETGLLVTHVEPSMPAAAAGLRAGDVITGIDDRPLEQVHELRRHLRSAEPGDAVLIDIVRGGTAMSISVTLPDDPR